MQEGSVMIKETLRMYCDWTSTATNLVDVTSLLYPGFRFPSPVAVLLRYFNLKPSVVGHGK